MNKIIKIKEVGKDKISRQPIQINENEKLVKPAWIKMKLPRSD